MEKTIRLLAAAGVLMLLAGALLLSYGSGSMRR